MELTGFDGEQNRHDVWTIPFRGFPIGTLHTTRKMQHWLQRILFYLTNQNLIGTSVNMCISNDATTITKQLRYNPLVCGSVFCERNDIQIRSLAYSYTFGRIVRWAMAVFVCACDCVRVCVWERFCWPQRYVVSIESPNVDVDVGVDVDVIVVVCVYVYAVDVIRCTMYVCTVYRVHTEYATTTSIADCASEHFQMVLRGLLVCS